MKPKFNLPKTKMCVVVFKKDDKIQELLLDTPLSNESLFATMLGHKVGYSQIRAVKSVEPTELFNTFHKVRRH